MKEIEEYAEMKNLPIQIINITDSQEAQTIPHPYGTYCILFNGEILSYRPIGMKSLLDLKI